jgi:ribosomal RNA-processing protein 8
MPSHITCSIKCGAVLHINGFLHRSSELVVADFGCGDARLARSIPNKVHSFDLVAVSRGVTACNMAHTPLSSASVDVVVFCLSLMGTNLGAYLTEANRVLKEGYVFMLMKH